MLHVPPVVCRIHLGIRLITRRVHRLDWSKDDMVVLWALAKEVLRTIYQVSKTEQPPTLCFVDGGSPAFQQLEMH